MPQNNSPFTLILVHPPGLGRSSVLEDMVALYPSFLFPSPCFYQDNYTWFRGTSTIIAHWENKWLTWLKYQRERGRNEDLLGQTTTNNYMYITTSYNLYKYMYITTSCNLYKLQLVVMYMYLCSCSYVN
jgi:hypothetical protein